VKQKAIMEEEEEEEAHQSLRELIVDFPLEKVRREARARGLHRPVMRRPLLLPPQRLEQQGLRQEILTFDLALRTRQTSTRCEKRASKSGKRDDKKLTQGCKCSHCLETERASTSILLLKLILTRRCHHRPRLATLTIMESAALERVGAAVEAIQRTAKTLLVATMRPTRHQPIGLEHHHHHPVDRLLFTFFLPPPWALARALVPLGRLRFLQRLLV